MEQQESFGRRLRQIMRERGLNYEAFGKVLDMAAPDPEPVRAGPAGA